MEFVLKLIAIITLVNFVRGVPLDRSNFVNSLDLTLFGDEIYNTPDRAVGKNLKDWVKSKKLGNPEEQGTYFQGDIMINAEARNGIILESQKWPQGLVPYVIKGSFNQKQLNMISDAIEQFKSHTCIRFVPRANEKDYVAFTNEATGCWSSVGKSGGEQEINFQTPDCMVLVGTVLHEILHALGFFHEQNRYDRDDFVRVNFQNIPKDKYINFEKMSSDEISSYDVEYDIRSVLHYSPYAFSTNNARTIESLRSPALNDVMGQREGFSKGDIEKINKMYCKK